MYKKTLTSNLIIISLGSTTNLVIEYGTFNKITFLEYQGEMEKQNLQPIPEQLCKKYPKTITKQ